MVRLYQACVVLSDHCTLFVLQSALIFVHHTLIHINILPNKKQKRRFNLVFFLLYTHSYVVVQYPIFKPKPIIDFKFNYKSYRININVHYFNKKLKYTSKSILLIYFPLKSSFYTSTLETNIKSSLFFRNKYLIFFHLSLREAIDYVNEETEQTETEH